MVSSVVYATKEELKSRISQTGDSDDADIDALLFAMSRLWDRFCGRLDDGFQADVLATAREYAGMGKGWIYIDECTEVTLVAHKGSVSDTSYTSLTTTDWNTFRGSPQSRNVEFGKTPFHGVSLLPNAAITVFIDGKFNDNQAVQPTVQVTARWGFSDTAPALIKEATIIQATIFYKRGKGAWSDVLVEGNFGEQRFVRQLDPAQKLILEMSGLIRPQLGFR